MIDPVVPDVHHYYLMFLAVFIIGLYTLIDDPHLVKKVIGLGLMQISVFMLFVSIGYIEGANPPLVDEPGPHANPLPHVIVLTAIVIAVSLSALALAIVIRLYAEFGTTDVREIEEALADE
ncbi:Multisubunit Na+/H+ antiporter, MnhC subunit [Halalkaliarchaeum sp. AArc-CO]|uniref:sodium:proton antiporter n=1 Tax=unclassified Halalkaliarchaeum TaxID=2678344 RepID=UPI00217E3093|nr:MULTISPECIES: cation:proton antiporter subunit C [unclassified Halalkaliarchaeum]MDR5672453.1 cation:proton antiporter subunit C [Halalkaliarchaeum sp. AArc-GB]UWG49918.1 Multisubunit Na+/H+ antiporter, MnhC subunit [Halalkaliarchaeum sp. AArc-CO]